MTCEIHNSFLWFEELYGDSIKKQVIREESTNHMLEKSFRGVKAQPQGSRHALGYIHAQMGSAQSPLQQTAVYNQGRGGRVKKTRNKAGPTYNRGEANSRRRVGNQTINRVHRIQQISIAVLPVQFTGTRQHEYRLPPVPDDWYEFSVQCKISMKISMYRLSVVVFQMHEVRLSEWSHQSPVQRVQIKPSSGMIRIAHSACQNHTEDGVIVYAKIIPSIRTGEMVSIFTGYTYTEQHKHCPSICIKLYGYSNSNQLSLATIDSNYSRSESICEILKVIINQANNH